MPYKIIMLATLNNLLPFAYIVLRSIDLNVNDYYNDVSKKINIFENMRSIICDHHQISKT
ncbi:hypothetical protein T4B_14303 [Trichinella pseudospiralis]|uniref:Uncharacterized protein n=2 Tax=Trichinella pseudospiralis TaxID=6337 RepID=A0A0V1J9Z3_TRIPS|nr:hypothetical protein T4D_16657 [Trichinella pseudospiralis]KRZ31774.1 hypothetical protein T4B_14303 [Trichinella pseudospiralis]KRZ45066.1 hypothetical protein T4C_218 [Trichinella pseudospiralis]